MKHLSFSLFLIISINVYGQDVDSDGDLKKLSSFIRGKNPDRDLILVEKRIPRTYAVPFGTEYSANILSLTGRPIRWVIRFFTNILSLTGLSKPLQVDYFMSLRVTKINY